VQKSIDKKKPMSTNHYIVGIGASAGGMEAIHDLFDYMPVNTGFSFVVIQHLSPDYKSLMAELLSRHTQMQVLEAEDGMLVLPNCIYVIPPKKLMKIQYGKLQLDEKIKSKLPNNAIDVFFESLAEDYQKNAIGIILSGTGTDGTKGLEAIKKRGGISIVQDPLTAAFDGMPNSAVSSGFIDLILPPEMIGEELLEYVHEAPLIKSLNKLNKGEEETLIEIIEHLHQITKHDFKNYKRPTLCRRLAKRMSELGIENIFDYKKYLIENEVEAKILDKEFLINVTKFFRDVEAFEALRTEAIPVIVSNKKDDEAIKVWIAACSSGEEAYSVAILFLEYFERVNIEKNFKVFATDIDSDALETASRGVYAESISKDVTPERLQKYFIREGNNYRIAPDLRKHVVFANHDILKDPPFSHLDLITCRNMFIYFNASLQFKALKKFHFALNLNSFLMLGPNENIDMLKDVVEEVNRKWRLYRCVRKTSLLDQDNLMMPLESGKVFTGRTEPKSRNFSNHLADVFKETILESHKMAAVYIDKDFNVKQAIGNYKSFLHFPEEGFNFNLLKLVTGDLAVALGVGVRKAINQNENVYLKHVVLHEASNTRHVNLVIKPYLRQKEFQQAFLCIVLEEISIESKSSKSTIEPSVKSFERINELEQELAETRENLQAIIEEMETANEELQASNEEMISTNEELQSTNEELQSLNEELHTVSGEHQLKIKELIELNDDLNNYFTNSAIGQILVDKDLSIRKFSPAVRKMINLIQTDIGRAINHITSNIPNLDLVSAIRNVIETSVAIEQEITTDDNHFYLMRIAPYVKRDGTFDGAVINFTDINESKKLSSILESIFASSVNCIMAKKAIRNNENKIIDFEYLVVNKAAEKLFGLNPNYAIGKPLSKVFPDLIPEYFEIYRRVADTGDHANFEFYYDKTQKWISVNVTKMLDGIVLTHADITDKRKTADVIAKNYQDLQATSQQLKDSNEQLERSNFDLLQFASVASHDLKEPLRKIQAFGNILKSKIHDKLSGDELNFFNKMISASDRMQTLIEDVLTLSKLSDNGLPKEDVDLVKLSRRISDDLEITIKEKGAVIEIGNLPVVNAVPLQMHQLLQNLISNALKFSAVEMKRQPRIIISSKSITELHEKEFNITADGYVCISVKDNGIGFEQEYKDKIFGIFQRLHGRDFDGTGIGLAIVKKIVENHGGYICANGELNEGAEFSIFLPSARYDAVRSRSKLELELFSQSMR
jgi:two-component system CheB/CheR fusion protein